MCLFIIIGYTLAGTFFFKIQVEKIFSEKYG